ncbi:MAG TPA: hypothetical protein VE981_21060 [Planctomycetota bacterium]|nr:hypothetical protein [Planctomycetota bacterium]
MTERPKHGGYRASPEDEAFYRRLHDVVLEKVRGGMASDILERELRDQGVPEKTAQRIVVAVRQEAELTRARDTVPSRHRWIVMGFTALVLGSGGAFVYRRNRQNEYWTPRTFWLSLLALGIVSVFSFRRLAMKPQGPARS